MSLEGPREEFGVVPSPGTLFEELDLECWQFALYWWRYNVVRRLS